MKKLCLYRIFEDAQKTVACLAANKIIYWFIPGQDGWEIWVPKEHFSIAKKMVGPGFEVPPKGGPVSYDFIPNYSGIYLAFILLACHYHFTIQMPQIKMVNLYGADALRILNGQSYRCITALFLHSHFIHLLGNVVGITFFGSFVASITGWGLGWLMILATGFLGNLINAHLYQWNHLSIGASTAVFGAIGILSGIRFIRDLSQPGSRIKAWLPMGASFALLAFLGSAQPSKNTDILAHLFGLISGLGLGGCFAFFLNKIISIRWQILTLATSLLLTLLSFYYAQFDPLLN